MPTYFQQPVQQVNKFKRAAWSSPATKNKRCARCRSNNYCPIPLGCFDTMATAVETNIGGDF